MKDNVFTELVKHESDMQKRLDIAIAKKDRNVLEAASRFEKKEKETIKQAKEDAQKLQKKSTGDARDSAKTKAKEYDKRRQELERAFTKKKKQIIKEVMDHMFA